MMERMVRDASLVGINGSSVASLEMQARELEFRCSASWLATPRLAGIIQLFPTLAARSRAHAQWRLNAACAA